MKNKLVPQSKRELSVDLGKAQLTQQVQSRNAARVQRKKPYVSRRALLSVSVLNVATVPSCISSHRVSKHAG